MRFSSIFVTGPAVAILSVELLCGLSGTAMSQTAIAPGNVPRLLPTLRVQEPKRVVRPRAHHAVARSTVSRQTSQTAQTPSAPESISAKLAQLEKTASSCAGGCATSFRSGDKPWVGCSVSGWPTVSPTCRNVANYKSYAECVDAGLIVGWRTNEVGWYCSSLALK
jgi:hypothetical protein